MEDEELFNELLALAGHEKVDANSKKADQSKLAKVSNADYDSSDSDNSPQIKRKKANTGSDALTSKKLRRQKSSSDNDSNDEFSNPYPLEGKYKDEDDRSYLLGLPELERESILYDREEEISKINERRRLTERLKKGSVGLSDSEPRKSQREKLSTGGSTAKRDTLNELKQRRRDKEARNMGNGLSKKSSKLYSSSEDDAQIDYSASDEDWSDDDKDDTSSRTHVRNRHDDSRKAQDAKPLTLGDIDQIRLGRKHCVKFMFHPMFEQTARGTFVLVKTGEDLSGQSQYSLHEVKSITKFSKPYKVDSISTDIGLTCLFGSIEKTYGIDIISNTTPTQAHFEAWIKQMKSDRMGLPSKSVVERKLNDLMAMSQHKLTDAEVTEMVKHKKSLQIIPSNIALEKTNLRQQLHLAVQKGDIDLADQLKKKIAHLDTIIAEQSTAQDKLGALAKVNDRNRRTNHDLVRKAELRLQEERKKQQQHSNEATTDPFMRLKTAPRIFLETKINSISPSPAEVQKTLDEQAEVSTKIEHQEPSDVLKYKSAEDVLAQANISLDIEI